ncbi:hypothetical protein [Methylococcus capsulatus]|uniref:hypothetical protein n=1 Tax=Methylococcus capsulatus TaxID=414 RepID=UPI00164F6FFB|nr:hypothetical protein [Methylococcus capsulatus]QXP94640.1 hypothetical protein KW113_05525 [Methylococcus capsulatus]
MNASEQHDDIRIGENAPRKPYISPVLSEYGNMTTLTQGALVLSVITPLTATLVDV